MMNLLYESDDEEIADVATNSEEDCVFFDIDSESDSSNDESVPRVPSIEDEIDSMQITYIGKPHTKRFPLTRFPKCVHFLTTLLLQRD